MKNKKKILSKYKRKINIEGREWTYQLEKSKFGSSGYLKVCNPQRDKKYTINLSLMGRDSVYVENQLEDLYYAPITPSMVKDLILKEIINK